MAADLHAAPDAVTQQLDSLRRQELQRDLRRMDDAVLPGEVPATLEPAPTGSRTGPCFPIHTISIHEANTSSSGLRRLLAGQLRRPGACMATSDVLEVQRELSNLLIDGGFVTSRILVPEQDLSDGELRLVLVTGHIESVVSEVFPSRLISLSLPRRAERVLNLRDLEQALENLNRIRGFEATLDLLPGNDRGESVLSVAGTRSRRLRTSLFLDGKVYGSVSHGAARGLFEIGSPLGLTDRLILWANTDVDTEISDRASGAALDYDLGIGYWLVSLGATYQRYENNLPHIFSKLHAQGDTSTARTELSRVLYRSNVARLAVGVFTNYTDVFNSLEDATISVSSYRLVGIGARLDWSRLWGRYQFGGAFQVEQLHAEGPATELPGGLRVADDSADRYQLYLSLVRRFDFLRGALHGRSSTQYSTHSLYPASRFSLTALVRGHEDVAFSGNTGGTATLEYSFSAAAGGRGLVRPYFGVDGGWVPGNANEETFVRVVAAVMGVGVQYHGIGATVECAWPWDTVSTDESGDEYVLHTTFGYTW